MPENCLARLIQLLIKESISQSTNLKTTWCAMYLGILKLIVKSRRYPPEYTSDTNILAGQCG